MGSRAKAMTRARLALAAALAAAFALAALAGQPASAEPAGIAPFAYKFRVVGFSMTATLTYAKTSATIRYRLLKPSIAKSLYYLGPHPTNPQAAWKGTFAGPVVDVVAEATYTSPDPSCTGKTIQYRPAGNKIVQVFVSLKPPRGELHQISAGVGRIPLAEPHPGEDGSQPDYSTKPLPKCGEPVMGGWYQDADAFASARLLSRPRVTITGHHAEKFTDPGIESIEWTLKVVLQRLGYRKIDCSAVPSC